MFHGGKTMMRPPIHVPYLILGYTWYYGTVPQPMESMYPAGSGRTTEYSVGRPMAYHGVYHGTHTSRGIHNGIYRGRTVVPWRTPWCTIMVYRWAYHGFTRVVSWDAWVVTWYAPRSQIRQVLTVACSVYECIHPSYARRGKI